MKYGLDFDLNKIINLKNKTKIIFNLTNKKTGILIGKGGKNIRFLLSSVDDAVIYIDNYKKRNKMREILIEGFEAYQLYKNSLELIASKS